MAIFKGKIFIYCVPFLAALPTRLLNSVRHGHSVSTSTCSSLIFTGTGIDQQEKWKRKKSVTKGSFSQAIDKALRYFWCLKNPFIPTLLSCKVESKHISGFICYHCASCAALFFWLPLCFVTLPLTHQLTIVFWYELVFICVSLKNKYSSIAFLQFCCWYQISAFCVYSNSVPFLNALSKWELGTEYGYSFQLHNV